MKSWKRTVKITILNINLPCKYDPIMEYQFCNERKSFGDSFEFDVSEHYHVFFNDLKIIFFDSSNIFSINKEIGGVSINLKSLQDLFTSTEDKSILLDMQIVKPGDLYSLDYYQKDPKSIGVAHMRISCKNVQKTEGYTINTSFKWLNFGFIKFDWIFEKFLTDYVARIMKLSFYIQQGTFSCRVKAILGLVVINLFQRVIYKRCSGEHDGSCDDEHCFKTYKYEVGKKRAKKLLKILNYSASAYATSPSPVLGETAPLRKITGVVDPVKKYILERCWINESDIVKTYNGSINSIGFISFFDGNGTFVVSFRGSCCKEDIFKILDADYADFLNGFAHEGFLNLSMRFITIEMKDILKRMKSKNCKKILFTGHSMGAAIAVCTYLLLINLPKLENEFDFDKKAVGKLKMNVIGFSCPPIVSKSISKNEYKDIEIYNYGNDVVPSISFGSIIDLKYLAMSVAFKKEIVTNMTDFFGKVSEIREYLRKSNKYEKLYCPGTIYHIRVIKRGSNPIYGFKRVEPEFFSEIRLSLNIIIDHLLRTPAHIFESIITNNQ